MKLPNVKKPCANCPFTKDSLKGWLGKERMTEILEADSFVCHKTINDKRLKPLQCAGHMILKEEENAFYRLANRINMDLDLSGHKRVFENKVDCITHHT